ncbi:MULTISPECIES: DUF3566 domain-containing protein [unclassified Rhodococcus (in: high G+C Gram-positive bacteria)]|uniref:DUF3566 domain-containing protein n=1 Tax=unclassified Rhodococcus (in: high G+C Gram-positive bacteria) TaxID=192944 RepID=UPI0027958B43|nr:MULTISPECIES: DUF3566 domain-containing protein [unclassified Rhodococcus (in: high G+C Gram-positive bacteria)]
MSTPNRPGSRPGPSGGPDSRDAARAEQPARPAPPEGARPGNRPQPATRPAPAAGRGPAPQGGARPPMRPAPGAPNGPARPAQGPPPQRPPAPQGPPPQAPPGATEQGAPRQGQAPAGPAQAQPSQAPGRPPGPGQQPAGRPNGGPPQNGQPPQRQAPGGQPPRQQAPQPSAPQRSAPGETVRTPEVSAESTATGEASRAPEAARGQDQAGPGATQAMPAQQNDGPQGGSGTPPWQRGQRPASQGTDDRQQPQNQPQTNLSGRGAALPPTGEFDRSARTSAEPIQRESTEDKTERREAARSKAAVIDGPTRHIERKDLAKDMPDLSAVRHPEPSLSERAAPASITAVPSADGDPLRATIQIRKIDPWSTLKIALVIAVSLFFVWMVSVGLLYAVLDGMGVWERLNSAFTEIVNESGDGGLVSAGQVFGYAAVIGVINVVLFTALTTIGAFIYNLSSDLVGGVEVTLADRD